MTHGPPPPEALSWAAQAAGPNFRVVSCTLLQGTSFRANRALVMADGFGRRREFVLRRWAGAGWEATDAEREAAILGLLEGSSMPAPRLVAADLSGEQCLVPSLLMTLLPGRPPSPSLRLAALLGGLAEVLAAIHAVDAGGPRR